MKVTLVFEDWRMAGTEKSIYATKLGLELSTGDFHSGTCFPAELVMRSCDEEEIKRAMDTHRAYPVFKVIVEG